MKQLQEEIGREQSNVQQIVDESIFPSKSSKLQELIAKYQSTHGGSYVEPQIGRRDQSLNVEVSNELNTKKFEQLSPANQEKVLARIQGIDYMKSADIQEFGSAKDSAITKHAKVIISKYSAADVGELADPITDLVATLKSNNPKGIVSKVSKETGKERGFLSNLREMITLKNAKKKMYKTLAEMNSIERNIEEVEVELGKQQINLRKDVETYEQMGQATYVQVSDFELDCIALQLMLDDAQDKLKELTSKGKLDLLEMNDANMIKQAIDRIMRRMATIMSIRVSTVQTLPQISALISGDEIIYEKIDEIIRLVIPMWNWQYAIAVGALKQKEALSITKIIRSITATLIKGNAKMLHDNIIAAQEEMYTAAVAIEDLAVVQEYIDDMVSTVNGVRKDATQKTMESIKKMQAIEQKNYSLMSQNIGVNVKVE